MWTDTYHKSWSPPQELSRIPQYPNLFTTHLLNYWFSFPDFISNTVPAPLLVSRYIHTRLICQRALLDTRLVSKAFETPTNITICKDFIMKLLLQSICLLAATAIALPTKEPRCEDLQKKLGEMAYRAHGFPNDNCATDHCEAVDNEGQATFYVETRALALQIHDIGCYKPEVKAAAQIQRRDGEQYLNCNYLYSQLVRINQGLETELNNLVDEHDRIDTAQCAVVQKSLPEIDIWSNKCASRTPAIGRESVNLVISLHRLGCIWNGTCGPHCFWIGDGMFDVVRNMGPQQCDKYDPTSGPYAMDNQTSHALNSS